MYHSTIDWPQDSAKLSDRFSLCAFTKMTLFKETGDFILLSYEMSLINDNDFLFLYASCISQNLDLPLILLHV